MECDSIKNANGMRTKVPMCNQGKLADFNPALATTTLSSGGIHKFAMVNADYKGKITVAGTAANMKGCSFALDTTVDPNQA
jgi:hypothetical protein